MKKIVAGLVLLVLGFLVPFVLVISLVFLDRDDTSFPGPGTQEFVVEKPAKYYLWNNFYGVHEGKVFSLSEEIPSGTTFVLNKAGSQESVPFESDSSISTSWGDSKKKSIGFFDLTQPGSYVLTISGLNEERLFSWGPSLFGNILAFMAGMFVSILLAISLIIGGIVLIILGIVEHSKKSPLPPGPTPGTPPQMGANG